jgi:hypothetical protein
MIVGQSKQIKARKLNEKGSPKKEKFYEVSQVNNKVNPNKTNPKNPNLNKTNPDKTNDIILKKTIIKGSMKSVKRVRKPRRQDRRDSKKTNEIDNR